MSREQLMAIFAPTQPRVSLPETAECKPQAHGREWGAGSLMMLLEPLDPACFTSSKVFTPSWTARENKGCAVKLGFLIDNANFLEQLCPVPYWGYTYKKKKD
jgi:hypothetical protein